VLAYDKRLQHLLTVAARTYAERGYQATSMRDLSKASGFSLAGIYHYVSSKLELLYLIQDRCFTQVITGAREALAQAGEEPEARLAAFIQHHVTFFAAHMDEMKVLSHESDELEGTMRAQLRRRKREYANLLHELLDQVPEAQISRQTAAWALFGMINWIYTWYHPTGPLPPEKLGEEMSRLFLTGYTAPVSHVAPRITAP
jgi:AcrR family transcriptional regulator